MGVFLFNKVDIFYHNHEGADLDEDTSLKKRYEVAENCDFSKQGADKRFF